MLGAVTVEASMYEHRREPVLDRRRFLRRVTWHGVIALLLLGGSLLIGILGFFVVYRDGWVNALLRASMILSGMGPVGDPVHDSQVAKLFSAAYALYSGVAFVAMAGIVLAPFVHRLLHLLHADGGRGESSGGS
jgi:hypothetical protein